MKKILLILLFQHFILCPAQSQWGLINSRCEYVIEPQYEQFNIFSDSVAWITKERPNYYWENNEYPLLFSLIDLKGNILLETDFQDVINFEGGLAWVKLHNKWGIIDKNGNFLLEPKFKNITPIEPGIAFVSDEDGLIYNENGYYSSSNFGLFNLHSKAFTEQSFSETKLFYGDIVWVKTGKFPNKYWILIDKSGKIINSTPFQDVLNFSDGIAWVKHQDKWGAIDSLGNFVIDPVFNWQLNLFDDINGFQNGVSWVKLKRFYKKDDKFGLIGIKGDTITDAIFAGVSDFQTNNKAWVYNELIDGSKKWGLIDASGKYLIEPIYSAVYKFKNGWAWVSNDAKESKEYWFCFDGTWNLIHESGFRLPFQFEFKNICTSIEGLENPEKKWGLVDKTGNFLLPPVYTFVQDFDKNEAWVNYGGKEVLLSSENETDGNIKDGYWFNLKFTDKGLTTEYHELSNSESTDFKIFNIKYYSPKVIILKSGFQPIAKGFQNGCFLISGDSSIFIDNEGKRNILPKNYLTNREFSDSLVWINTYIESNLKWGAMDMQGNIIIKPQFRAALDFKDGVSWVDTADEDNNAPTWRLIDKQGKFISEQAFYKIKEFYGTFSFVESEKKDLVVSKKSKPTSVTAYEIKQPQGEFIRVRTSFPSENPIKYMPDGFEKDSIKSTYTTIKIEGQNQKLNCSKEGKELVFHITNTGVNVLHFLRFRSYSTCVSLEFEKTPIQPGETLELKVKYKPRGRTSLQKQKIALYFNTEEYETILHFEVNVAE